MSSEDLESNWDEAVEFGSEVLGAVVEFGSEVLGVAAAAFVNAEINTMVNNQSKQYQLQQSRIQIAQAWIYHQNIPQLKDSIRRYVLNESIQEVNIMNNILRNFLRNFIHNPVFSQKVNWILGCFHYWRNFYKK